MPNTTDKQEYKRLLIQLKDNMQNDILKQYGQQEKPVFITVAPLDYRSINMSLSEQRQRNNELAKEVIECRDILYSVPEAAKLLHVNKNMVYDLIRCGYLRSIKLGSRKVSRKALLDFVEQFEGQTVELPGVRSE